MERMTKIDENIQTAQNMLSGIVERCYELEEENKRLKATLDAYAKQVSRLEQRLLKYEKVHDGKFIEKDITTSESKPLLITSNNMEKTMECQRCGKIIKKMGNRKYCTSCRVAVDKEINSATRRKLREKKKRV